MYPAAARAYITTLLDCEAAAAARKTGTHRRSRESTPRCKSSVAHGGEASASPRPQPDWRSGEHLRCVNYAHGLRALTCRPCRTQASGSAPSFARRGVTRPLRRRAWTRVRTANGSATGGLRRKQRAGHHRHRRALRGWMARGQAARPRHLHASRRHHLRGGLARRLLRRARGPLGLDRDDGGGLRLRIAP